MTDSSSAVRDPVISVIVVTHDSMSTISRCLAAIDAHPPNARWEVIVVDNASTDGTAQYVAAHHGEVRLLRSPRRRGFAANCNAGAHEARGDLLVFLNPDARVRPGAFDELTEFLLRHPRVAVAGARLIYPDGRHQPSARQFPSLAATMIRRTPLRLVWPNSSAERRHLMDGSDLSRARTVDWVLGAAIAVPAQTFRQLGGMDGGYRLYCEDIDLCWRAWQSGLQVAYVPDAVVEHDLGELTRRRFVTRATLWHLRGMARFVRRHGLVTARRAGRLPHRTLAPEIS